GVGIAKDKIEDIFEAFKQEDSSTTRRYGGTGLGLSISLQLTRMMEGEIWAESEVGVGTIFHFVVPFELGEPCESADFQALSMPATVALLADRPEVRAVYGGLLAELGAVVRDDCKTPVDLPLSKPVDILVVDVAPGDIEFLRQVHRRLQE